jgi:energy-converting hydrogenase A subunit R
VTGIFISDCEGPISKNDDAFEVASNYIPNGSRVFTVISRYDDVLSGILKRPSYGAGDTVKLVLPFLKAYGVTDKKMKEFAANHLILVPYSKNTLVHVMRLTDAFIVSTSYETYIKALCEYVGFPFDNTCSTRINLDLYQLEEREKEQLRQIAQEISRMPIFDLPANARSLSDFPLQEQQTIERLDEIFWKEIASMKIGRIYSEITAVGGTEKAEAVKRIIDELGSELHDVMYVGDSITDVEAFKMVKENDGLTVSFNGNQYAVENAEIAVISDSSLVTGIIADVFVKYGTQEAEGLVRNWNRVTIQKSGATNSLIEDLLRLYPDQLPKAKILSPENMGALARESSEFRSKFRGEAVGRLG